MDSVLDKERLLSRLKNRFKQSAEHLKIAIVQTRGTFVRACSRCIPKRFPVNRTISQLRGACEGTLSRYVPRQFSLKGAVARVRSAVHRKLSRLAPKWFPISYKLALAFTLVITGGMVALGVVVMRNQSSILDDQMINFGTTVTGQVAEAAKEQLLADDSLGRQALTNNLVNNASILGAAIYSEEVLPLAVAGTAPPAETVAAIVAESHPFEWVGSGRDGTMVALSSFVSPVVFEEVKLGFVLVTFDRSFAEDAERQTMNAIIGATLLLVLIGIIASIWLGKRLTRPIFQLMDASRAISEGDYQFRFEEQRNDELGALMASMNTMTEGLLRKEQVEKTFSRYVSPKVAKEVLSRIEEVHLGGRHVEATVVFADIVGFTSMSENMQPNDVSELLNEYFTYIAEAAQAFGGYVDKYIGDCAMLVFGVPELDEDHMFRAVSCAVLIQRLVQATNRYRERDGKDPIHFRVGVNSGLMLAGNMGSRDRMEYTVLGDSVNLASRLASLAQPDEIVITERMSNNPRLISRIVSERQGDIKVRGKKEPVGVYVVKDVADDYRKDIQAKEKAILSGGADS